MKVTLIQPPTVVNLNTLSVTDSMPPLGLAYLSAALKRAGYSVHIIDAPGESITEFHPINNSSIDNLYAHGLTPTEILERIPDDSQVIGISHMFLHSWPLIFDLTRRIKEAYPQNIVVLGGETPTAFWSYMMDQAPSIDICVLGEGENKFVQLLSAVDQEQSLDDVAGIVIRDDKGTPVKSKEEGQRLKNLDELALPDWGAFDVDTYLDADYNFSSGYDRGRSMPLLATRGCPYQCTFCSSPEMWTTRYVMRSPKKVVDEIESYIKRYRIDNIDFVDLTAIIKKSWILDFCKELIARNIKLTWQLPNGTRSEALDREVLTYLYRAGCRNITYAPESGSERLLKDIKKRVKLPHISASMKDAVEVGLVTNANMIIGLPGETWKDMWLSYKFGMKLAVSGLHSLAVMIFAPYPGSELFGQLTQDGKIELDEKYFYSALLRGGSARVSFNERFSPRVLVIMQIVFLTNFWGIQYLIRPLRLVKTLFGFLANKREEETLMDNFLHTKRFYKAKRENAGSAISLT